jgi:hypothetical protein
MRIKAGGNVADIATSGTGAWAVVIEGLDSSHEPISATIATNGATVSDPTTEEFLRVDRAYVTSVGTGGVNAGAIVIETTGGVTLNSIEALEGQSQICAFTVPAGQTAYILGANISLIDTIGAGTTQHLAHYRLRTRLLVDGAYQSWRTKFDTGLDTNGSNQAHIPELVAGDIPEKTDVKLECYTHASAAESDARLYVVFVSG